MAKVSVYDMTGAVVSDLELNDNIFGIEPNTVVMHAAVVNYLAISVRVHSQRLQEQK